MSPDRAVLARQLQVYKGLVEVSALINGILDEEALLPAIMAVTRRVLGAEAASLFLVNRTGDLELKAANGGEREKVAHVVVPRGKGLSGWVLEHGKPLLVADAYDDSRFFRDADRLTGFRTRSVITVPMSVNGQIIGVLQGINPVDRETFDEADLEAFAAYGNLAATALDRLKEIARRHEEKRLQQEFAFAHEVQSSFLPQTLPQPCGLEFAASYRPALNIGGDFYDVVEGGPGEIYFVIGDVSGKGMPAALVMAQALSGLRLILQPGIPLEAALRRWNEAVTGHTVRGMFITALLGRILLDERSVEFASAGHCSPILIRENGPAEEVIMGGSPPLGILPEICPIAHRMLLQPGEWIVLFTDGLTESFNEENVLLDRSGAEALLTPPFSRAADIVQTLLVGELKHRGDAEPHDDMTLLTFGFPHLR